MLMVFLATTLGGLCEQMIPEDLKTGPVNIAVQMPGGTSIGTGLYLLKSNGVFLVTAKHVFYDASKADAPLLGTNAVLYLPLAQNQKHILKIDLRFVDNQGLLRKHPTRDIAVLLVGLAPNPNPVGQGVTIFNRKWVTQPPESSGSLQVFRADDNCLSLTNIPYAADVLMVGYPVELLQNCSDVDFSRPLFRKGIISQITDSGRIIVDSGVYGGNSGGPLLIIEHPSLGLTQFRVAGVMVRFVPAQTRVFPNSPYTNSVLVFSGYSVAEPIDGALELMSGILKQINQH